MPSPRVRLIHALERSIGTSTSSRAATYPIFHPWTGARQGILANPLVLSWQQGAQQWDQVKRGQFAADPANLVAVDGNQAKGASGPGSWLPPNKGYRCRYVIDLVGVTSPALNEPGDHQTAESVLRRC